VKRTFLFSRGLSDGPEIGNFARDEMGRRVELESSRQTLRVPVTESCAFASPKMGVYYGVARKKPDQIDPSELKPFRPRSWRSGLRLT
jgi:hypothetical protein